MPSSNGALLNAEPALPEERKDQSLPPKSFADAVQQDPPVNGADGSNDINGTNEIRKSTEVNSRNNGGDAKPGQHTASVLRIVDTGVPGKQETPQERPEYDRKESQREFVATVCIHFSKWTP